MKKNSQVTMEHQFLVWCCTMATTLLSSNFCMVLVPYITSWQPRMRRGSMSLRVREFLPPWTNSSSPQHTTSTSPACTCISCTTSSCAYDALAIGRVSRGRGMRGTHLAHSSPALCTPQDLHCSISSIMHLVSSWQGEWWPCSEVRGGQRDEEDNEIWCSTRMTACCLVVLVVGARMMDGGCWGWGLLLVAGQQDP